MHVNSTSDEDLMVDVKAGNLKALSPLFEKYHIKLYNFFLRLTQDRDLSEDLVQSVFRRIINYRKSFNEQHQFRSWMYQIARNELTYHYKKHKMMFSDYHDTEHLQFEEDSASEEIEAENRKLILHEAMKQLSQDQREIIELSKFQGLRYKEIGEILQLSKSAVKVKIHRSIKKLKELYFKLA